MAAISDHNNLPPATAKSSQKPCGLLELPPELRNNIYELCFKTVYDNRSSFSAPTPPEFAILQTCRQIHSEAIQVYQVADREYWSDSHFWLERETYDQAKADAESMRSEKMRLMNKITIALPSEESPGDIYYLTREPKSWGAAWVDPLDPRSDIIVRRKKKERSQCAEQKWSTKKELLGILSKLREDGTFAK
ncbi:hypothetical protein D0869_10408 [Hortaea werneckii]|uniref:Uncharacterized protein n=1 Tax=Hortaea werneckii TaxID=91943 RepID=A0A3M6Y692_HORWE|nr:hypothetical protein KC334_g5768 [Hortaea werneckii]KAI7006782.1 hypothetical protein KC355_g7603 [Hortaea werneckii]KAI7155929.1 hypothetical protein KC324_g14199 [Hortaea werneckii]KAI7581115.1 hypothetical protein KC316_g8608 [Hortaea werneckii]KAI7661062.1 hypothetical protein KC318_g9698 [Hortaea werneckii]